MKLETKPTRSGRLSAARNRTIAGWLRAAVVLDVLGLSLMGADLFVAPDGNDEDAGTLAKPWGTIQHGLERAQPGDRILVRAGVYRQIVRTVREGEAGLPIVLSGYSGERPVIDGTGNPDSSNGIIVRHSYIVLSNLEVRNWNETGIWVENAGYLEISDCEVHDVSYGIGLADGTHHFTLNRVVAHHFDLYGFDASPSGGADCHHGTFNECVSYSGRDPEQNVDGFALGHGGQHDFTFNHCETYDVFDGFDISAQDVVLSRCSAHHCWNGGYKLWEDNILLVNCLAYRSAVANVELDWIGHPAVTTLQHCTLVGGDVFNIWVENNGKTLRLFNSILADGAGIALAFEQPATTNYQADFNVFHNRNAERAITVAYDPEFTLTQVADGTWYQYSGQDRHSISSSDPQTDLFTNLNDNNFHLCPASLAIDLIPNTNSVPENDFDGMPRLPPYDSGAFAFFVGEPISPPELSIARADHEITLSWQGATGWEYQILSSTNLLSWSPLGGARPGTGQAVVVNIPMTEGQRLQAFRVQAGSPETAAKPLSAQSER